MAMDTTGIQTHAIALLITVWPRWLRNALTLKGETSM
jgi:hypothetical protein